MSWCLLSGSRLKFIRHLTVGDLHVRLEPFERIHDDGFTDLADAALQPSGARCSTCGRWMPAARKGGAVCHGAGFVPTNRRASSVGQWRGERPSIVSPETCDSQIRIQFQQAD
jgi:hypothetical protein